MGNSVSFKVGTRSGRVVLAGLDGAGKTTLLYGIALGNTDVAPLPTTGFNFQSIQVGSAVLDVVDLGGSEADRANWAECYDDADGLVFVVDPNDVARLHDAQRALLKWLLGDERLDGKPLLVLLNHKKQHCGEVCGVSLSRDEISERLRLSDIGERQYAVFDVDASDPTSSQSALSWLNSAMHLKPSVKAPLWSLCKKRRADQPMGLKSRAPVAVAAAAAGATTAAAVGGAATRGAPTEFSKAVAEITVNVILRITLEAIVRII